MSGSDQNKQPPTAELSVVVPTFKERGNVAELVRRLDSALTRKRMETIDDEVTAHALRFIEDAHAADEPFFVWYNTTAMHFRTHVAAKHRGKSGQDDYADVMVAHDENIGRMLDQIAADLQEAVQELRNLAHGIYPPLLMDRGLPDALRAAADRARSLGNRVKPCAPPG